MDLVLFVVFLLVYTRIIFMAEARTAKRQEHQQYQDSQAFLRSLRGEE